MSNFWIKTAQQILEIESKSILDVKKQLNHQFSLACEKIVVCQGKVILMGLGKSGHIAKKIAATFASTGTSAFFVHPSEAGHGDLGMIDNKDIVILISYSGENDEILSILPVIKKISKTIIAITGNTNSSLAKNCTIVINVAVKKEACPNNLAPTSSTTVTLAIGDALAVSLIKYRNFSPKDFALYHPKGNLGKKLITTVSDVMRVSPNLPVTNKHTKLIDCLTIMSKHSLGIVIITDSENKILGVFTDGDLRRHIKKNIINNQLVIDNVMNKDFKSISAKESIHSAIELMEKNQINALVVKDEYNKLLGAFNLHVLMEKKLL